MKRPVVWLLIVLPVLSVVMTIVMYLIAVNYVDPEVETPIEPLSKSSYRIEDKGAY